jgi:lipopolysaccharide export system protein LptA
MTPRLVPVIVGLLLAAPAAVAQEQGGALKGLNANRDQPVKIESSTLEVRDKQRQATFSGDVKLVQGDTTLKCKVLVVFYEDSAMTPNKKGGASAPQAQKGPGAGGSQQIRRAEAKGNVFVTQKDQTASGDEAIYDLKSNTITMTGNVVLTQGPQVLRGAKMIVELETGFYRFIGGVEMLAMPGAAKDAPAPGKDAKPAPSSVPPPPARSAPKGPIRIN